MSDPERPDRTKHGDEDHARERLRQFERERGLDPTEDDPEAPETVERDEEEEAPET